MEILNVLNGVMESNIFNVFKKKRRKSESLEMKINYGDTSNKGTQAQTISVDTSNFQNIIHVSGEIQHLQKIQSRTKKKRAKKKLQKRIDAYGRDSISRN